MATISQVKHAISVYEFWRGLRFPSQSAIVGGKRDPLRPKYTLGTYYYGHFVGASARHRALTVTVVNGIKVMERFWRSLRFPSQSAIVGGKRDPLQPKYTLGTYYYGHFVGARASAGHRALTVTVVNIIKVMERF